MTSSGCALDRRFDAAGLTARACLTWPRGHHAATNRDRSRARRLAGLPSGVTELPVLQELHLSHNPVQVIWPTAGAA